MALWSSATRRHGEGNDDGEPRPTPTPPHPRHPGTWFFTLAVGLSWLAWTPYVVSENGLGVGEFTFPGGAAGSQLLGVLPGAHLGPIVSALLVTRACAGRAGLRAWRRCKALILLAPTWPP
ncbi:hypothetical protein [Streptomyces sp. NPDC087212]|uniref:hypothetical protein n=1 Tax=Streptomyces sp. NPDC087212 TaxID=3365766 RepID=UPI00380498E7